MTRVIGKNGCAKHSQRLATPRLCGGYIDGTVRAICRPSRKQTVRYNGHKRVHAIKLQNIGFPDGIMVFMDGPYTGSRHDGGILLGSKLESILHANLRGVDGRQLHIYGDPAYTETPYVIRPFRSGALTERQIRFHTEMSVLHTSVEWSFGKIIAYFPFADFRKNSKLCLQPVGKYYLVATVLTNCHTCCYGSQANYFFDSSPPTLGAYLNLR